MVEEVKIIIVILFVFPDKVSKKSTMAMHENCKQN